MNTKKTIFLFPVFFFLVLGLAGCERKENPASSSKNTAGQDMRPGATSSSAPAKAAPNPVIQEYLSTLPNCKTLGLLDESECGNCRKQKSAECVVSYRAKEGVQCY